jgi:hypothetical protein
MPGSAAEQGSNMIRKVFGLIERNDDGGYQGRILGFEHIFFEGPSPIAVEQKLRAHVAQLIAGGTLILETDFESVVELGVLPDCAAEPEG